MKLRLFFAGLTLILLAKLSPSFAQQELPTAGKQVEMKFKCSDGAEVPYLLYLPTDFQAEGGGTYPLIFFLHGRGESNGPLSLVAKWGPPKLAARGDKLPYVILSPQCPSEDWWSSEAQQGRLVEMLDEVVKNCQIDESRIYLTGLSMGGYGSWKLAANQPERFAAVVPICGGGDPADADKLKDIPIWIFHGDQDTLCLLRNQSRCWKRFKTRAGNRFALLPSNISATTPGPPPMERPSCIAGWMTKARNRNRIYQIVGPPVSVPAPW